MTHHINSNIRRRLEFVADVGTRRIIPPTLFYELLFPCSSFIFRKPTSEPTEESQAVPRLARIIRLRYRRSVPMTSTMMRLRAPAASFLKRGLPGRKRIHLAKPRQSLPPKNPSPFVRFFFSPEAQRMGPVFREFSLFFPRPLSRPLRTVAGSLNKRNYCAT